LTRRQVMNASGARTTTAILIQTLRLARKDVRGGDGMLNA